MNSRRAKQPKGWTQNQITESPFSGCVEPLVIALPVGFIHGLRPRVKFKEVSSLLIKAAETEVLVTYYRMGIAKPSQFVNAKKNYREALRILSLAKKGEISIVPTFRLSDIDAL